MSTTHSFTSPVGRLVGGDIFTPSVKNFDGRPLTTRDGEPRSEYVIQVAFPKSDPDTEKMRTVIYQAAVEGFPSLFPGGQPVLPTFSYKWTDGDSAVPNMRGNKPCDREGFPGHWVITFKSSFAPSAYDRNNVEIIDPKAIKRGDYVRVAANCRGNGQANKPGVYVNHSMVRLEGLGEEIRTGPDAATAFAEPPRLPPEARMAPSGVPGGVPGGAPAGVPSGVPAPPAAVPTPAPGFGAAPIAPAPPPPAAARQMAQGCPFTYEALAAQGWSDEQMRAQGWLA
jgi:hypothetical protein